MLGGLWLASCGPSVDPALDREWPAPSPAMWEATGPDGQRAWLFGTIHALPDGAQWRTPLLDDVQGQADVLMVEVADLGDGAAAREAFEERSRSNGLQPLLARVEKAERNRVADLLGAADMDQSDFAGTETWAAALQLGNAVRCTDSASGVDRALLGEMATVLSIESYDSQFAMFDALSASAQADLLLSAAQSSDCDRTAQRVEDWLTGNTDAQLADLERGFRGNEELRNAMLVSRNRLFAESLAAQLVSEPGRSVLLAVGAGHMPGPEGVVALLEAKGFTLRRIQ